MSPYRVPAPPLTEPCSRRSWWWWWSASLFLALLGAANFIVFASVLTLEGENRELERAVRKATSDLHSDCHAGLTAEERAELDGELEHARRQ